MMDPEIFINQKILKSYVPIAEPMASLLTLTRVLKKFRIEEIVERERIKGEMLYKEKVKLSEFSNEIEVAKIEFSTPKSLFHCLFLNTLITEKLSLQERIDWTILNYKKLIKSRISFYNREVIRENFINGVQSTIYLFLLTKPVPEEDSRYLTIDEKVLLDTLRKLKLITKQNFWKGNTINPSTEISVLGIYLKQQKLVNPQVYDKDFISYLGGLFKENVGRERYSQVKNDLFPKENKGEIDIDSNYYSMYQQFLNDIKL